MRVYIKNKVEAITDMGVLFEELGLEEHTLYRVSVKILSISVEHNSFLFTGFNTGTYCQLYNNTYDCPLKLEDVCSITIEEKLSKV